MIVTEIIKEHRLRQPTIVLIGFSREKHFLKVLESIENLRGVEEANVCMVVQKSNSNVLFLARQSAIKRKSILLTEHELGISARKKTNGNIRAGLEFAFDLCAAPYAVILEDDTVLAEDALYYFGEMHRRFQGTKQFRGVNAFSNYYKDESKNLLSDAFILGNYGLGWGWSINKLQFNEMKKVWTGNENEHWDAHLEPYLRTGFVVNPVRSRVVNIGLDGTGTNSEKSEQLFTEMLHSSTFESNQQRIFNELNSHQITRFWRKDYFIFSGRPWPTAFLICSLFRVSFSLRRLSIRYKRLIPLRKLYSFAHRLAMFIGTVITRFQELIYKRRKEANI